MSPTVRGPRLRHRAKMTVVLFVLCSVLLFAVAVAVSYAVDPLQLYRKAAYSPRFSIEERYQNAGLIKHWEYDTIIVGTSMTQNFVPSQVGRALGGQALKLSMEGSVAEEHYRLAQLALGTGKVRKVLWGLDYFSLRADAAGNNSAFPGYLYDHWLWNDIPYLFNYSTYERMLRIVEDKRAGRKQQNLEYLNNWSRISTFGKDRVADAYAKAHREEADFGRNEPSLGEVERSFVSYILPLAERYPEVAFHFYYPPYSVLRQAVWQDTNPVRFHNQLMMRKRMFEQFARLPNVKVYDFQTEDDWTFDLDLYKDLSHHHEDVNRWIADAIGRDDSRYRVTEANIDRRNAELAQQAETAVLNEHNDVVRFRVMLDGSPAAFTHRRLTPGGDDLLVPVRQAAKALGAEWTWDPQTKTVALRRGGRLLELTAGSPEARLDGVAVPMAHASLLADGVTLVPVGFVAEQLGYTVRMHRGVGADDYVADIRS